MTVRDDAHLQGRSPKEPDFFDPVEGYPMNRPPQVNDGFVDDMNLYNDSGSTQPLITGKGTSIDNVDSTPDTGYQLNYDRPAVTPNLDQYNRFGEIDDTLNNEHLNGNMNYENTLKNIEIKKNIGKNTDLNLKDELDNYFDSSDTCSEMDIDNVEDKCSQILAKIENRIEIEHLLVDLKNIDDKATFFKTNKKYFYCSVCGDNYKSDGFANSSYRLKCSCGTKSLGIALAELQELIELRFDDCTTMETDDIINEKEFPRLKGSTLTVVEHDIVEHEKNFKYGVEPRAIPTISQDLETERNQMEHQAKTLQILANLETRLSAVEQELANTKFELAAAREENLRLQLENAKLNSKLEARLERPAPCGSITTYDSKSKELAVNPTPSFADLARALPPQRKTQNRQLPTISNSEELARFFRGQPIKAPRKIVSVYSCMQAAPFGVNRHGKNSRESSKEPSRDRKYRYGSSENELSEPYPFYKTFYKKNSSSYFKRSNEKLSSLSSKKSFFSGEEKSVDGSGSTSDSDHAFWRPVQKMKNGKDKKIKKQKINNKENETKTKDKKNENKIKKMLKKNKKNENKTKKMLKSLQMILAERPVQPAPLTMATVLSNKEMSIILFFLIILLEVTHRFAPTQHYYH